MKGILIFALMVAALCGSAQDNGFSTYYNQKRTLFEQLPDTRHEIIFLGNSITDGAEWAELFNNPRIKNRGISGDTTDGILYRLKEVTSSSPDKIFLMIGINDLSRDVAKETVFANICRIAEQIRKVSPRTEVFVQSILPVNASLGKFAKHTNKGAEVIWVNNRLKDWCGQNNYKYIDIYSRLVTPGTQELNPEYTNDGLHLTSGGYLRWAEVIRPDVKK
ncbi:MAG: GDSL-type esterase/lipase family protein [Prolixibacteraceae bacterium]